MSFTASLETDTGEVLNLLDPSGNLGGFGGKAILSFLTGLEIYCSPQEDRVEDINQWFSKLETIGKEPLCHLNQPLLQSYYSGDWDYAEDEYEFFLHRSSEGPLTEDSFRETIQAVKQKWVDVQQLLENVSYLTRLLAEANMEAAWWYEPHTTEADFRALLETSSLAAKRGARQVRIQFT